MRVLIVDDHTLFRAGLRLLLAQLAPEIDVIQAGNCTEALVAAQSGDIDLVLLDWHMEGLAGFEALEKFRSSLAETRVVVLSGETSSVLIRKIVDQGAAGFIPKDSSPALMIDALRIIIAGGVFLPGQRAQTPAGAAPQQSKRQLRDVSQVFPDLTQRQADVLCAAVRGLPNKLIARELNISDATVKQHLSAVFRVLEVTNRTEAVYVVAQNGVRIG